MLDVATSAWVAHVHASVYVSFFSAARVLKDLKKGQVYVKKGRILRFEFGSIFGLSLKSLHAKKGRL